ncbi:MAG: dihydrofolate reductase [Candidatus Saccharimonadales bacterium]
MTISAIITIGNNGVIGKEKGIQVYLPADLAHFKKVTMGHPIIMGRKTHEKIGQTLPGRDNIVLTRNKGYKAAPGCIVVHSLEAALKAAGDAQEVFVIGGESVYQQASPMFDRLYLTNVKAEIEGNKYFRYEPSQWKQIATEKHEADDRNQYAYEFVVLERTNL